MNDIDRARFDLEQRKVSALERIAAALEAQQWAVTWDVIRVKYWSPQPIPDWVEDGEPAPNQVSVAELTQDGWSYWRAETVREFDGFGEGYFDTTYYLMRRPRQQPAPDASDAGDGDAGRDWKNEYKALRREFDRYRWDVGERMTRPPGASLRVTSWNEPRCPVCNETMEWLQDADLDDDDSNNYWRWICGGCGTELARDEHPAPATGGVEFAVQHLEAV